MSLFTFDIKLYNPEIKIKNSYVAQHALLIKNIPPERVLYL